jgi:hypothetical protein
MQENSRIATGRTGFVDGMPRLFLRIEALAVAAAAVIAYARTGQSWWMFFALFLAPDLSMLAYLIGPRSGALIYNAVHNYAGPLLLLVFATSAAAPLGLALGLIWAAHIGVDRLLGYGLKHVEGFAFTHLGRIGRVPLAASDPLP